MSRSVTRRRFLLCTAAGGAAAALKGPGLFAAEPVPADWREVMHYAKLPGGRIVCETCPNMCQVDPGERGTCGVHENRDGTYYTLVYNKVCTTNLDPVEKKPLFHYLPGSKTLSIATAGCNMACKFCQNWNISQARPEDVKHVAVTPAGLVDVSRRAKAASIACTYSEPTVFYELMHDTSVAARKAGLGSVVISNGYISAKALKRLAPHLTAYKVDLKAFTEQFYRDVCEGKLQPVLDTLLLLKELKLWTEIVVLIIPTLNDGPDEIRKMTAWIRKELGPDVPVHFTRFHPTYRMKNLPPTPVKTLERCRTIGLDAGLHHVYLGNVPGHEGEHTYCPGCGRLLIKRVGFFVLKNDLKAGACPKCGRKIAGVWSLPRPKA